MDKEQATRVLAKELGDKLGRIVVIESSYKNRLIENASSAYQVDNPLLVHFCDDTFFFFKNNLKNEDITELIKTHKGSFTEANYYFLEAIPIESSGYSARYRAMFAATPYALIGEKEKALLKKMSYKNVHHNVVNAMNALDIENFIGLYKEYMGEGSHYLNYLGVSFEEAVKDLELSKKFIGLVPLFQYDRDEEVKNDIFEDLGGVSALNKRFERMGISARLYHCKEHTSWVPRESISQVFDQLSKMLKNLKNKSYDSLLNEFIDFVFFSMPYEDQNITANKELLKKFQNIDFAVSVLVKEYSKGNYFQDYFDCLDKEVQESFVKHLKTLPAKDTFHDSFLWSKGFKDIELDYMSLYKNNAKGFIEYFNTRNLAERKAILKNIMECESVNEEVADWLNRNETDLVREVGFNG